VALERCDCNGDFEGRHLIAAGADVNAKNKDGKTALGIAKEKGHDGYVKLPKAAGAKS